MGDKSFEIVINDSNSEDKISLPVNHDQLGGFISSLLGQSQTIERELYGTFSIDHSWLVHLHSLIDQRIKQQNHGSLTAFKAIIFYKNNLKRTLTSIEAFEHFSETKKIESQSIKLSWTYLINFPNKEIPEKQEISFYATAKAPITSKLEDPVRRIISKKSKVGAISYQIDHTERTWGDDIETLVKQELDLILDEESKASLLFSLIFALLALVFLFGGMIVPDIMNFGIQEKQMAMLFQNYQEIVVAKASTVQDLGNKVDLILKAVNPSNGITKINGIYRILSMIFGIGMAVWCIRFAEKEKPSFVVLTPESEVKKKKMMEKQKRNHFVSFASFIISVAAGIAGNYFYYILTTT